MLVNTGKLMSTSGGRMVAVPSILAALKDGPISEVADDKAYVAFSLRRSGQRNFVKAVQTLMA